MKQIKNIIQQKIETMKKEGFAIAHNCNRTYFYDKQTKNIIVVEHDYNETLEISKRYIPMWTDEGENIHTCFDCVSPNAEKKHNCEQERIYYNLIAASYDVTKKLNVGE